MISNMTFSAVAPALYSMANPHKADSPKHRIQTTRLDLRPVSETDLTDYIEIFSDPAVMSFIGIEAGTIPSVEEIVNLHEKAIETWETHGFGRWSMFDRQTGEFIGFCGFRADQGKPELICAIHQRFWGKGFAAEAARACLDYGFVSLGFSQVKAFTRPNNVQARKALDKTNGQFIGCTSFYGIVGAAYLFSLIQTNLPNNLKR